MCWRLVRFPQAVLADARHPLRHVFVAAIPSSLVLLPTVWVVHAGYSRWVDAVWMLGAAGLLLVTLAVLRRWLQPGLSAQDFWATMTPALFIPVVGHVLPALAGVSLGHPVWAAAQFGLAAVLWPVALVLVLVRIGMVGLWPQRMLPPYSSPLLRLRCWPCLVISWVHLRCWFTCLPVWPCFSRCCPCPS